MFFGRESEIFNDNKTNKLVSALIILMAFLSVYRVPVLPMFSFGEIVLLLLAILLLALLKGKVQIYINSILCSFIVYAIVSSIVVSICQGINLLDVVTRLMRDAFYYILIFCVGYSYINYDCFIKYMKIFCVLLSLFIIFQELYFFITGKYVFGVLMSGVVSTSSSTQEIYQDALLWVSRNGYLKANGFLAEAAHCVQFLSIGMISLIDFKDVSNTFIPNLKYLLLFSIASICTFAASAMIYIGIIWIIIIFLLIKEKGRFQNPLILALFILLVLAIIVVALKTSGLTRVLNRLLSASSSSSSDGSSFVRLYKGYAFWMGMPIFNKIFGIGFGNYSSMYPLYEGPYSDFMSSEYMNSLSYVLVSSGVIGFILFICFAINIFRRATYNGKICMVLLMLMFVSASVYSSVCLVWAMLIILNGINIDNENVLERRSHYEFF